jgi:PBSX family phage portal protein
MARANKTDQSKKVIKTDEVRRRKSLTDAFQEFVEKSEESRRQYSRQVDYDDIFESLVTDNTFGGIRLLTPPYKASRMYELYEQSAVLSSCIEAYVHNIDGFGFNIVSSVSDDDDKQMDSNPNVQNLKEFFNYPNDKESFDSIRKRLRRDYEVTGNGYIEVIRGKDNKPSLMFYMNAQRIRLTTTREPVICDVQVVRNKKVIIIKAEKRFRSYCMMTNDGATSGPRVRFFKEYGDTRIMDAVTGEFNDSVPIDRRASELIHFKQGNGVYGIPRWIASLLSVMGGWKANLVNYDLFDNQGIPPLIISVSGGELTQDSFDDLVSLFKKAKGANNFHKLLILQAEGQPTGVDGKEAVPRLNISSLSDYRQEDAMFLRYLEFARMEVQKLGFRLPGTFLGISDDANYATAYIVRTTAEEQIFVPERTQFDEIINRTIVRDLIDVNSDLRFKSNGPVLQSKDEIGSLIATLVNSGAFTVNGLISFVNSLYGLNIALYDKNQPWADEPIPVALESKKSTELLPGKETANEDSGEETQEYLQKHQNVYAALQAIEKSLKPHICVDAHDCGREVVHG